MLEPLLSLFLVLVIFSCLTVWSYVILQWRRGEPVLAYEPRLPVPWTAADLILVIGVYLILQIVAGALFGGQARLLAASLTASVLTLAFAVLLVKVAARADGKDLGLDLGKLGQDLGLGLVAFPAVVVPVYLIQLVLVQWYPSEHPLVRLIEKEPEPSIIILGGVTAVLVAPVVEEFLFRVLLQGWLEARETKASAALPTGEATGPAAPEEPGEALVFPPDTPNENPYASPRFEGRAATALESLPNDSAATARRGVLPRGAGPILLSSLLFASLHLGHGPDPIPLFFLALALGYLYQRTHRLLPCVVLHMSLNAFSMSLLWLKAAGAG
jgi:membrane protease YdiL (CAAX protease family)